MVKFSFLLSLIHLNEYLASDLSQVKSPPSPMSLIVILFVEQKCTEKASLSVHVINFGVWNMN